MIKREVSFWVNGDYCKVVVDPWVTLLQALREKLKLTGTKRGCDNAECGACTVLVDDKPTLSCITLAVEMEDSFKLGINAIIYAMTH